MDLGYISVKAIIVEGGNNIKGTLTIFADEYVFNEKRCNIDWDKVEIKQGVAKLKGIMFSSGKPYISFVEKTNISPQYFVEQPDMNKLIGKISSFANEIRRKRVEEEEQKKKAEAERIKKEEEKARKAREEQERAEEAERQAADEKRREQEEKERTEKALEYAKKVENERKIKEKKERIAKEVEACREKTDVIIKLSPLAKKAGSLFLDNPYRLLGVSCVATNEEANNALDKLKKLARLKALGSYRSGYDLSGIEKPDRELSVVQNALVLIKNNVHKWFWFLESDSCAAWYSGKYRIELCKDGQELGNYDLFLSNYIYAVLCDSDFDTPETWKRILNYYCFLCNGENFDKLKSRFTENELATKSNKELLDNFRNEIFKPLLMLCDTDDIIAVLRLYGYIRECDNVKLKNLTRDVLDKVTNWFNKKKDEVMSLLEETSDDEVISAERGDEIYKFGIEYCNAVDLVLIPTLSELKSESVRSDMIKGSYKTATYQLMYELNKCSNKSNAIYFANKTFPYCKEDDQRRIRNTFGFANIKAEDKNIAHTGWDIMADHYRDGDGGYTQDYTKAYYWYHKAADEGNMYSMNSLGLLYQKGWGVPQSDEQAAEWFERAMIKENPDGAFNLAECYFEGRGKGKNVDKALELWSKAAKWGHPSAAERRQQVFEKIKSERKARRRTQHICIDLGFQMPMSSNLVADFVLSSPAYAYLMDSKNYQSYLNGEDFVVRGGYSGGTSYQIVIPSPNHWYAVIDNGDNDLSGITATAKAKTR